MFKFFRNKLAVLIPTYLGITILSFSLIRLVPGDPVLILLGERGASPEQYQEMKKSLGMDRPLIMQYILYIKNAFSGDFGNSIISKRPVLEEFSSRFPATVELGILAIFLAVFLGIPLGMIAAIKRNSFWDYTIMGSSLVGYSMPIFWWGLILIIIFSVQLGWTPVSGRLSVLYDVESVTGFMLIDTLLSPDGGKEAFIDALKHLILPGLVLATIPLANIARMTRSSMLEVLGEDYIRTAWSKGLAPWKVIGIHALRNALIPVVTIIGISAGSIVTGAILTETIFSWPGIGKWIVASVMARDYPVIQGGILIIASMIIILNATVDALYSLINPRMRGAS